MPKPTNHPKLSAALREQKEQGALKVETFADAALCSTSTAYSVFRDGAWDELYADIRHMLAKLPAPAADAVLGVLLPAVYAMPRRQDACGDINGDGRVDAKDALAGAVLLTEEVATTLRAIHGGTCEGGIFTEQQGAALGAAVDQIRRMADRLTALLPAVTAVRQDRPRMKVG
jgi:hypothetical protein